MGFEARDLDALVAAAISGQLEVIHHPTGATYGAPEVLIMYRGLWRGRNIKVTQEVLATLDDSLALLWPAFDRHGAITVLRRGRLLPEGGAFESVYLFLALAARGRLHHLEFFEIADLDTALARFEELRPHSEEHA